jgi:hypothetical protein
MIGPLATETELLKAVKAGYLSGARMSRDRSLDRWLRKRWAQLQAVREHGPQAVPGTVRPIPKKPFTPRIAEGETPEPFYIPGAGWARGAGPMAPTLLDAQSSYGGAP